VAVLRISAKTNPLIASKAIVGMIHKHNYAEVQALGGLAVRRAEQTIGRAASLLQTENIKIVYRTMLVEPDIDGNEKAGIRFMIRVVEDPVASPGPAGIRGDQPVRRFSP